MGDNVDDLMRAVPPSFAKSVENGYIQAHPLNFLYTAEDLATDEATLSNNYMKLIFGGAPGPADAHHRAYLHSAKQFAEAPVTSTLDKPVVWDLSGPEITKNDLLDTFAQMRKSNNPARLDNDAVRMLRSRVSHEQIEHTYYGKRHGRFHHIAGQSAEVAYPPSAPWMTPRENLSSRTGAPLDDGTRVPLHYALANMPDPRTVPVENGPSRFADASVVDTTEIGSYYGSDTDRYLEAYSNVEPPLEALFGHAKPRF